MPLLAEARGGLSDQNDAWLAGLLGPVSRVALVAVGGYGRRELLPGSDLDVLLLHDGQDGIAAVADRVWYPVWDSGVALDHAVRTVAQARNVAREDLKAALGLLSARHVAGDKELTEALRRGVLTDWRSGAPARLAALRELCQERAERFGELAFLLEPDLKEARGGMRDVHAIAAIAAAWVAPAPGPRVRAAYEQILDARHALHEVTGRGLDRLVLEEQDAVAARLGMLDGDVLLRTLAGAARTISYATDQAFRHVGQSPRGGSPYREPLADGIVVQDGEVMLARRAAPERDPVLLLRAAAAAAQAGLPLAPRTLSRLAQCPPLPVPWPATARDALVALLGAGHAAIGVWEALEASGLVTDLIPDWERVRNRPQRNPLHRYTVDRHLVETAAYAAQLTREVARPDLLLLAALLHDIGKGWPGDHSACGAVVAADLCARFGLSAPDTALVVASVRHHLLLPEAATRRDLDDPATVRQVVAAIGAGGRSLLELLHALAIADGLATGPAAWNDWKATLVADLVRRVSSALDGTSPASGPEPLREDLLALAAAGGPAVFIKSGASAASIGAPAASIGAPAASIGAPAASIGAPAASEVIVVAPDRPGLLWQAAGVLASHRLAIRAANATSLNPGSTPPAPSGRSVSVAGSTAISVFQVVPVFGEMPDAALVAADLRRMLSGRLDIAARLDRRAAAAPPPRAILVPPPKVALIDDASDTATVVEVRAHDAPGLLWRIGRALGDQGLDVRAARVETLGAEAVDVFYVTGPGGTLLTDPALRTRVTTAVLAALAT